MIFEVIVFLIMFAVLAYSLKQLHRDRTYKLLHSPRESMDSFIKSAMTAYGLSYLKISKDEKTWSKGVESGTWEIEIRGVKFWANKSIDNWQLEFVVSDVMALSSKEEYEKVIDDSNKMVVLGEMAAGIAHEINNPLAIVHGKASICQMLLEEEEIDKERLKEEVKDLIDTAERMDKIINSLRYFVRDDKRDPLTVVSTTEILNHAQVLCVDRCRKQGIKLLIEGEGSDLLCKPTQISQVLVNLVSNSIDAIKDLDRAKWIKISAIDHEQKVVFSVEDCGTGITPEIGRQILNSFYTTKKFNKSSGLGLGLNIVKRIVESHFGSISLDYESETTKFIVEIPKSQVLDQQSEEKDVA